MHRASFGPTIRSSGRASPYSQYPPSNDRSLSDLYTYVDEDPNILHAGGHARSSVAVYEDEDAPDIIHIRYKADAFSLRYPPFSISESKVKVRHVREQVAARLGVTEGKIRLVYKGRDLIRNDVPLRKYGCKQNSEISVVVTQESVDYNGHSGHSGSDSDSAHSARVDRQESPRLRSNSTYRRRDDPGREEFRREAASNGFLHPTHAQSNGYSKPARTPSPSRTASPKPAAPAVLPPEADLSTPLGKIQAMNYEWHSKWVPELDSFLKSPPPDKDDRVKEYRRLNESVYKRVFEVGDLIDAGGDEQIRSIRKACFADAQKYLNKLDKFKP